MMKQFLIPHIVMLLENGFEVEIACSDIGGRLYEIQEKLRGHVKKFYTIRLVRSPFTIKNIYGYKDLKEIIKDGNYDLIWTNEPVMGVSTRLAAVKARKAGTKVIYMAHGFHFFKGAPLINWLLYYPVEKICSRWTDVLITINKEDYERAKKKFHVKKVEYIPGVGLDTKKFRNCVVNREKKCEELGIAQQLRLVLEIPLDAVWLISVGELNRNKNHRTIIKALAEIGVDKYNLFYTIVGSGKLENELRKLIVKLGLKNHVKLLGYRNDIKELLDAADVFCFPSRREGLGLAAIEAMACGLPLITSNIHGINDYSVNGITGYTCSPNDVEGFAHSILKLVNDPKIRRKFSTYNQEKAKNYDIRNVYEKMKKIYTTL